SLANPPSLSASVGALDQTSALEFSYRMKEEFPGQYSPQGSSYSVVLTKNPGVDTYVDVVPKPTRTYNSDLAFDPAANFGQNEAVQVNVSTPQATIQLNGNVRNNDTWVITIDGVDAAAYQWTGSEVLVGGETQLEYIAKKLKIGLDQAGTGSWREIASPSTGGSYYQDLQVAVVGSKLVVQTYSGAAAAAIARPANAFVAGFRIDPDSQGSATALTTQTVELSGAKATGDVWTITLNGTAYAYTAVSTDDLAAIARALQIKIGSSNDFTATVRNRTLTITRADGAAFTLAAGSSNTQGKAIVDASTQFKLAGTPAVGEIWTLTLNA